MTKLAEGLILGSDGKIRCAWAGEDVLYRTYHDEEWGKPVYDDRALFEKICLEGFQAGLSWLTILKKRQNFRSGFDRFDFDKIAFYDDNKVTGLMQDKGIIRHCGKIRSVINNAKRARELIEEKGSLADYFWSFVPLKSEQFQHVDFATLKANPVTPASTRLSKDLKSRGWSFVGPTTCYAFMQSVGIVNDHIEGCFCR
ncbi:DNA-3-methyladenine glycosylase I [uncultured Bartonella sp.]|uniref:DNA-3-methyladenine glycosylase I n=1 Tax=uncultured Bartonella sp. TaxID=104108 RepID=UPI0026261F77|nr:DNA-3-methyladenine glycosylase I [uncultured Bartonella sp.]